jgi:hypothetical protein
LLGRKLIQKKIGLPVFGLSVSILPCLVNSSADTERGRLCHFKNPKPVQFEPGFLQNPDTVKVTYCFTSGFLNIRPLTVMEKTPAYSGMGLSRINVLYITANPAGRP